MFCKTFCSVAVAIAMNVAIAAAPPVAITIRQPMGGAPLWVRAQITVPPHDDNRQVCFILQQIQNGAQERSSCWNVEGAAAPLTTWREVKSLPSGRWSAFAVVMDKNEKLTISNRIELHSIGFGYEPPVTE